MRIDESENSTLQLRSEIPGAAKLKEARPEMDEKPAKKGGNKKDKPEHPEETTPKKVPKGKKGKKKQNKHEESSEEEAHQQQSDHSSNGEDEESGMGNHKKMKAAAPKEVTAADRKKAKKLREQQAKHDPADSFDPMNMKPARAAGIDDDLKAQIAKFGFRCSACPFGTDTNEEFKAHFKCEWHRINLQRKVAEQAPLTEEQFKEMAILKEFV